MTTKLMLTASFSFLHAIHTGTETHPASNSMGSKGGGAFLGLKLQGIKLTIPLQLVPMLRKFGPIHPLLHAAS